MGEAFPYKIVSFSISNLCLEQSNNTNITIWEEEEFKTKEFEKG